MIPWFKRLFTDELVFVGILRAGLLGLGGAVATGQVPLDGLPHWVGIVALAAGGFVRSSSSIRSTGK